MAYYIILQEMPNPKEVSVVKFEAEDSFQLAEKLSPINLEELEILTQLSPPVVIGYQASRGTSYTIKDTWGNIYGAFGVIPEPDIHGVAGVWMITTHHIQDIALKFIRDSYSWITTLMGEYELLYCHVYEKNNFTRRWLKMAGFIENQSARINDSIHPQFIEYVKFKE